MKLFHFPTSPYVRKVEILLRETGQLADVEIIPAGGTPLAPAEGLTDHNPLGKIPALARPDGATLYDSRVICQYLDARANAGLYGEGETRWNNLVIESTGDGIMDAALLITYEARLRPADKQFDDYSEAQWSKITQAVAAIDSLWIDHLRGPLSIGHIAVASALGYLDLRHDARNWRKSAPLLDEWFAGFAERDSLKATIPPK